MEMATPLREPPGPGSLADDPIPPVDDSIPPSDDSIPPAGRSVRRRLITVLVLATALSGVLLAVPGLRPVARDIGHMSASWLAIAVGLELASCLAFVVVFRLFFERIPATAARELAWTEMGSGALLPGGGVGSLAIGGWLLHLAGMSTRRILERSSALFFYTSATNVAALVAGGVLLITGLSSGPHDLLRAGLPIAAGIAVSAAVAAIPLVVRRRSASGLGNRWLQGMVQGITETERLLRRPAWRSAGAIGYLAFDIAALWATLSAVGYSPPIGILILGYIIGYLANILPVPGSVGVLEGGLAGTLILYGAPATQAAAGVLVYHAIAFWVPSAGGLAGYALLRRRLDAVRRERARPDSAPATEPESEPAGACV